MNLRLAAGLALLLVFGATPALAQTASGYPCGKVTAYTAPTTTTAGSIAIGTSTFQLAAVSVPERPIGVGQDVCLQGQRNAAGAFISTFTVIPMGEGVCGVASAYTPSSTTTAGSITLTSSAGSVTLPVGLGVTLSAAQASGNQCYALSVNAQGNAQVRGYSGPWESGTVAPRQLPATSTLSQGSSPASVPTSSTPLERCGRVTAFGSSGTPQTNAGRLYVDGLMFVVGHPQNIRRSDIPPLTVPYASIRLDQTVCVRGLVDPLPGGWHLLSGEVVITDGLPNTRTALRPPGQTEVSVCGRLSAFSAPTASRPQGGIAINRDGTLVEYKVAGAGTVTPPNITGLGTAMTPVTVRFSGTVGSDGVVTSYSLTQVASCQGPASLPGTATSGSDSRWMLASGVFGMAILIALARRGSRVRRPVDARCRGRAPLRGQSGQITRGCNGRGCNGISLVSCIAQQVRKSFGQSRAGAWPRSRSSGADCLSSSSAPNGRSPTGRHRSIPNH